MRNGWKFAASVGALWAAWPATAQDRTILPMPAAPFDGVITENVLQSRPATPRPVRPPQGAPNVLLFMSDDVGFAMSSAFGGPVPTPNFERLARMGQRYNRFNTTAICSPSRAALLTGRNHHNAGVGYLSDLAVGFPGYGGKILPETATIAQVLRLNGYSTAMFGKHHNVPSTERTEAGPFDAWPTGLGFDYFFGFVNGDTDQYSPNLYRDTARVDPDEDKGTLLDRRLADDLIRWVHNQKGAAPDKPFLVYWAPGSTHAPHQAPPEWIARFNGKFDQGWDKVRQETWRRQLAAGIIPKGTKLTARPEAIPAWESLTPGQKAFATRTMEVAAAQLAYEDEQFGRVLAELERMGVAQNTLIALVIGDNGASGEAGAPGTINELRSIQTHDENEGWMEANIDKLGGPQTYENYPVGWAWAMDTPYRWTKQFASMLGGVRNGMIMSWPGHVARPGTVCGEFGHLVDLAPTVLEAAQLPAPKMVLGTAQKPIDGQSLLRSLTTCDPKRERTQYFEIGGKMGLYHNGWFLSGDDGRPAWEITAGAKDRKVEWTLYNLDKDFSQSTDLSQSDPQQLGEMMKLWTEEATRNHVYPVDPRRAMERVDPRMVGAQRKQFEYWGKDVSLPAQGGGPYLAARPFTLRAELNLDRPDSSGAVVAWGSRFGGWSLFLDQGRPAFAWAKSTDPSEMALLRAGKPLPAGASTLNLRFVPAGPGQGADVVLSADGAELVRGRLPASNLSVAGGGETFDIGRDLGVPVTSYRTPRGAIEGDVPHVVVTFD